MNFEAWLGTATGFRASLGAEARAVIAWAHIQDDPVSITVYRNSAPLPAGAQTVRITLDDSQSQLDQATETGITVRRGVTIFGVRDHPDAGVPDTDIQNDDLFIYNGDHYEVKDTVVVPGEVQARAERRG